MTTETTARERIADAIERCQRNWDRMLDIDTSREDRDTSIRNIIHFFAYTALLELCRQRDESYADQFARWLDETIEEGGGVGEWLWQWRDDLAVGRSLTLPNFTEGDAL